MKKINILVVDQQRPWHAKIERPMAEVLIGALSADPGNLDELLHASLRFVDPTHVQALRRLNGNPIRGQLGARMAIDFDARVLVVPGSNTCGGGKVDPSGLLAAASGDSSVKLDYNLHSEWHISNRISGWKDVAEQRKEKVNRPWHADRRATLYGKPAIQFWLEGCERALRDADMPVAETAEDQLSQVMKDVAVARHVRSIHAAWMMHSPDGWGGTTMREAAMEDIGHIGRDIESRIRQWTRLEARPEPLRLTDSGLRRRGFGFHELCVYYDLVRTTLYAYFKMRLSDNKQPSDSGRSDWMRSQMDDWLNRSDHDPSLEIAPQTIIDTERRRLPLVSSGSEALDCDCPMCQIMEDDDGPSFIHFSGVHMEMAYPFGLDLDVCEYETDDDDDDDDDWDDDLDWDGDDNAPTPWPDSQADSFGASKDGVWERVGITSAPGTPSLDLFAAAACTAELICDIKERDANRQIIDQLNRQVANLKSQLGGSSQVDLLMPVVVRYCSVLDEVQDRYPDLARKVEDLQSRLMDMAAGT